MPISGLFSKKQNKGKTISPKPKSPVDQLSPAQQQARTEKGYALLADKKHKIKTAKPIGVVLNCQI
jgi:hypothetical protein